jgi:hypothetical protein
VSRRGRLSPERVAYELFHSTSRTEAAARLGISHTTLYKYLRDPSVLQELDNISRVVREATAATAVGLAEDVIVALREELRDSSDPWRRLRAAQIAAQLLCSNLISSSVSEEIEFSDDSDNEDN